MTAAVEPVERPVLEWHRPDGQIVEYTIWPERPVTIGREATNTIAIDSPFVSKAHAIFQYSNGEYVIEDLKSANGTKLNGAPISVSLVKPGDVIELGDQQLRFVDRAVERPTKTSAGGKTIRLAAVALITAVVMIGLMMMLVGGPRPAPPQGSRTAAGTAKSDSPKPPAGALPAPPASSSSIVQEVLTHAERAGIKPDIALLDAGTIEMRTGRLRGAVELFSAAVTRNPGNELARIRFATAASQLEEEIEKQTGAAERAFAELRFAEAAAAWERVGQLTAVTDPRNKTAQEGWRRAKERLAR